MDFISVKINTVMSFFRIGKMFLRQYSCVTVHGEKQGRDDKRHNSISPKEFPVLAERVITHECSVGSDFQEWVETWEGGWTGNLFDYHHVDPLQIPSA